MNLPHLIAQGVETLAPTMLQYGPLGVMCLWFMWRAEKVFTEIRGLGHRIDGLTKALLVDMANRESCGIQTRTYAREAIAKIDARSTKEGGKE